MLLDEVTCYMIDTALLFPNRGLVWVPENGQIVYRKFQGAYVLNKARDPSSGLETDSYWVDNENFSLAELKANCVWLPNPHEIRDLAEAHDPSYEFMSLAKTASCPDQWKAEYAPGLAGYGTNPWEAEFYILDKFIIGICTE